MYEKDIDMKRKTKGMDRKDSLHEQQQNGGTEGKVKIWKGLRDGLSKNKITMAWGCDCWYSCWIII